MDNIPNSSIKYCAFISYRHLPRDTEVARTVQRALETFRLPRGVATSIPLPAGSRLLGKCFRDEDELSASHSLPERLKEALAQSRSLIVVCTPDTPKSEWVNREIAEFIDMHGRERVIAVLASGASEESIPPILKHAETVSLNGVTVRKSSNPLAADLRGTSPKTTKKELLRIISAVVGCDFDNLYQRQRARRKRRIATIASALIAVLVLVTASMAWAMHSINERKISESKELASQSQQLLANGDRMKALETALQALPSSSSDCSKPITEEAKDALESALQVNPDPEDTWRASYSLQTPGNVASFASSVDEEWIAILDDTGMVSIFDLETGAARFAIDLHDHGYIEYGMTADDMANEWAIVPAKDNMFLTVNRSGRGNLACFDARNGNLIWEHEKVSANSVTISKDKSQLAVFSVFEDLSILLGIIDVETGEASDWAEFDNPGLLEFPIFIPSLYDSEDQTAYLGSGGYLFWVDLEEGTMNGTRVNDYMIQSLEMSDGIVVAASSYRGNGRGADQPFAIEGIVSDEVIWSKEGSYDCDLIGARYQSTAIDPLPCIEGFANMEGPAAVLTVGKSVYLVRPNDGTVLASRSFESAVVGAGSGWADEKHDMLYIVTAYGAIDVWMPFFDGTNGETMRTLLPASISNATIQWYKGRDLLALLQTETPKNRVLVYRLDPRLPEETVDLSLDDQLSEAREILNVYHGEEGRASLVNIPEGVTEE